MVKGENKKKDLWEFLENMTWAEVHELDVEGASDKPRRGWDKKNISEKLQKFPSDIIAWHEGG